MEHKYHASKVETEEGIFDSKKELKRWQQLKAMEAEGVISDLKRQFPFELIPRQPLLHQKKDSGKRAVNYEHAVKYVADFVYRQDGEIIVEDTKGYKTPDYLIKRKLMLWIHGIQIKEV